MEIKVNIKGASTLIKKFNMFQALMEAGLLPAWNEVARRLHAKIIVRTPILSGALVRSTSPRVMPMHVQSIASAVDARTGFNYARIQHDGGYASGKYGPHMILGKYYMTIPLAQTAPEVPKILEDEIDRIIALCGLG